MTMKDDLIKRSDAIEVLESEDCLGYIECKTKALVKDIKAIPSADRPQGRWIYPTEIIGFGRCSNCKALWDKSLIDNRFFLHCPRCGAKMEGADDETD